MYFVIVYGNSPDFATEISERYRFKSVGQGKCVSFLEMVTDDLNKKVKARIDDLIAKPEQLKFKMDLQDGILGEP